MIVIPAYSLYRLHHQNKGVVFQRPLYAVHHLDFIFQPALHIKGTTLLQIFWMTGGEGEIGDGAQLPQQKIEMDDGRAHVAVAHSHLRL